MVYHFTTNHLKQKEFLSEEYISRILHRGNSEKPQWPGCNENSTSHIKYNVTKVAAQNFKHGNIAQIYIFFL